MFPENKTGNILFYGCISIGLKSENPGKTGLTDLSPVFMLRLIERDIRLYHKLLFGICKAYIKGINDKGCQAKIQDLELEVLPYFYSLKSIMDYYSLTGGINVVLSGLLQVVTLKVAYIDDDIIQHTQFKRILSEITDISGIECFDNRVQLFSWLASEKGVNIIFSETVLNGVHSMDIIGNVRKINPHSEVVFLTKYPDYALSAFDAEAFGYILKPCTAEKIKKVIRHYKRVYGKLRENIIRVHTFGRFDVFSGNRLIHFSNKKSKELLALMIDRRGGSVTMEQVIDALWEDRVFDEGTKALYRIALKNLRDTLEKNGCRNIIIEKRGERCIDTTLVDCDFYNFMDDPVKYADIFNGEYMVDYPWGEYTLAQIVRKAEKILKIMPF